MDCGQHIGLDHKQHIFKLNAMTDFINRYEILVGSLH